MRMDPKTVHAPEIGPIWLNSAPLTLRQLRGRVVLIDFWDFTCVNCIRTLPYVAEWHRRYEPLGLTVIGVHAPEFYFGRAAEILEQGIAEFGIRYPVLLDNDYAIWKAFANKYWPSKYLIDPEGYMRYFHAGEGAYEETELAIQDLLRERDSKVVFPPPMTPLTAMDQPGALAACQRPTPELYLGHWRGRIANEGGFVEDKLHIYTLGAGPMEDTPELGGPWHSLPDCAAAGGAGARLCLMYSGAEVNLVASPTKDSGIATLTVRENGLPIPPGARGQDLTSDGVVVVNRPRLYRLIRRQSYETALLEISTESRGVQLFAFTFGTCP